MSNILLTLLLVLAACGTPESQPPAKSEAPAEVAQAPPQDTTPPAAFVAALQVYKVGVIRKGINWKAETPAKLKELTAKNAEPWRAAIIEGSLVGVANVVDPGEIVSVLFFRNKSDEAMSAMAMNSPAVKDGLVKAEIAEVWGTKGLGAGLAEKAAEGMKAPATKETYYLVYTTKGKKWSADSESPETRKSTNDQIRYLAGLYKGGAMKYFGAFTDMNQNVRGFGIFKTASDKEALEMMQKSPAVMGGMLEAGVKTVEIAEGTF